MAGLDLVGMNGGVTSSAEGEVVIVHISGDPDCVRKILNIVISHGCKPKPKAL
ncbi:hypothetical protein ACIHJG_34230 [Streptomyces sp. NPDC052415]|uniref:hypothetical protein n=1 Tax=Streptomyces sp. NPDC052415 TaxID=3365690 RepID=UPI0037D04DDC